MIYTSGSTGQPKGVVIEHRQVMNFLHRLVSSWALTPRDAVLAFSSLTFDVSVLDMFMPLLAGAGWCWPRRDPAVAAPAGRAAAAAGITFVLLPPAVLSLLDGEPFPALRMLLSAARSCPASWPGGGPGGT